LGYISTENLMKHSQNSIYKLVVLAARRALELSTGSEKLVEMPANAKITSIALEEIKENKISCKTKKKS
jgi:DNA-directed RNA polymerase omega subunit